MERLSLCDSHEISASGRPLMDKDEISLIIQSQVGIYDKEERRTDMDDCSIQLTSSKIFILNKTQNSPQIWKLYLSDINNFEFKNGLLAGHPKIILYFGAKEELNPTRHDQSSLEQNSLIPKIWKCPICESPNKMNPSILEQLTPDFETIPTVRLDCDACGSQCHLSEFGVEVQCWQCSFNNKGTAVSCDMCSATIWIAGMLNSEANQGKSIKVLPPTYLKLSFRGGGYSSFCDELKKVFDERPWENSKIEPKFGDGSETYGQSIRQESPSRGIAGIINSVSSSQSKNQESLDFAMSDLDKLMAKAEEMVHLSKNLTERLKHSDIRMNETQTDILQNALSNLGVAANPITRGSSSDSYHTELAHQISDILKTYVDKKSGMITLAEAYCYYNRSRGSEMISPKDMYEACRLLKNLELPLILKEYGSGLRVLQSSKFDEEVMGTRVMECFQSMDNENDFGEGLSAHKFGEIFSLSSTVAKDILLNFESKGLVCRDDSMHGLKFYPNLFCTEERNIESN